MAIRLEPRPAKTCPHCGAAMDDVSVGWLCPICKTFINLQGGVHLHEEKAFRPPVTNFDKVTASPEVLAEFIAERVVAHIFFGGSPLQGAAQKAAVHDLSCTFLEWFKTPVSEG